MLSPITALIIGVILAILVLGFAAGIGAQDDVGYSVWETTEVGFDYTDGGYFVEDTFITDMDYGGDCGYADDYYYE